MPNVLFRDWLTKHYSAVLNEALGELGRAGAVDRVRHGRAGGAADHLSRCWTPSRRPR